MTVILHATEGALNPTMDVLTKFSEVLIPRESAVSAGLNGRVPVPPEKRFHISQSPFFDSGILPIAYSPTGVFRID